MHLYHAVIWREILQISVHTAARGVGRYTPPFPSGKCCGIRCSEMTSKAIIYLCPSGHYKIFHHGNYRFVQPDKNMQARQNVILCHLVVLNLWATYTLGTLRYTELNNAAARPMVKSVLASWKCSFTDCTSVVIGLPSPYSYLLQYYIQLTIVLHKQINGGGVGGGL